MFTSFGIGTFGGAQTSPGGVAIAPGGKIVVAGTNSDDAGASDIAAVRYGTKATAVHGRPDLLVGYRGAFVGDGIDNHTGYHQTITRSVARGRSASFGITIQNDGNATDTIRVVSNAFRVRDVRLSFFDHGVPIPAFEWSFAGHPEELAVGASTTDQDGGVGHEEGDPREGGQDPRDGRLVERLDRIGHGRGEDPDSPRFRARTAPAGTRLLSVRRGSV